MQSLLPLNTLGLLQLMQFYSYKDVGKLLLFRLIFHVYNYYICFLWSRIKHMAIPKMEPPAKPPK